MRDIQFMHSIGSTRDASAYVRAANSIDRQDQVWDEFEQVFVNVESYRAMLELQRQRLLSVLRTASDETNASQ